MSANAFARAFDDEHHSVFADLGMGAGTGQYRPPYGDGDPVPDPIDVRVYVAEGQATLGEFRQQRLGAVHIGYLRADVAPVHGSTLVLDGETWINEEEVDAGGDLETDSSISVWAVRRG